MRAVSILLILIASPLGLAKEPELHELNWPQILLANEATTPAEMTKNLKDFVSIFYPESNEKRANFFLEGARQIALLPGSEGYSAMKIVGKDYIALIGRAGHGVVFVEGKLYATRFPAPVVYEPFETVHVDGTYEEAKATARKELVEWVPRVRGPKGWSQIVPTNVICRVVPMHLQSKSSTE